MNNSKFRQNRLPDLADRSWDLESIRKRLENLRVEGFGPEELDYLLATR